MQGVLDCSLMSTAAFCLCLTVEFLVRHTTLCPSGAVTRSDLAAWWNDLFCCMFFFIDNENIEYCATLSNNRKKQDVCLEQAYIFEQSLNIASRSSTLIFDSLGFSLILHDVSGREAHARNNGKERPEYPPATTYTALYLVAICTRWLPLSLRDHAALDQLYQPQLVSAELLEEVLVGHHRGETLHMVET